MANRKTPFVIGEYYHIYNRGVDKRIIFSTKLDIDRFFKSMIEFNIVDPIGSLYENSFRQLGGSTAKLATVSNKKGKKLVNIVAYCLNPNHFHFILEQLTDRGISEFMKRLSGGYTWYFNNKYDRTGSLFQGRFKAVHVNSNEYLLHVSAYVNLNDKVHQLGGSTAKLVKSKSSWGEYTGDNTGESFCKKEIILEQFKNKKEYKKFATSSLESIVERKKMLKGVDNLLLE